MRQAATLSIALVAFALGVAVGTPQEYPDAVTADPDHYSVEFENDVVRLLRIEYGAGETSVMHHHPANCAIFINDQAVSFELPSGEVVESGPMMAGDVMCSDAENHLPTNTGDGDLEVILVELKGRDMVQE